MAYVKVDGREFGALTAGPDHVSEIARKYGISHRSARTLLHEYGTERTALDRAVRLWFGLPLAS